MISPEDAPKRTPGLYLLHDHENVPRYIGQTMDLWDRIYLRHCSGDGNSHKWSTAFNAGRLWHDRKNPKSVGADGKIAKALRAQLARRYCHVRVLPMPEKSAPDLSNLEHAVRKVAQGSMTDWNDQKAIRAVEPTELVDRLIRELRWGTEKRDAIDRQAIIWRGLIEKTA